MGTQTVGPCGVSEAQPTFLFDNNLARQLANGMKGFGESAVHLAEIWPEGDPGDEALLTEVGRRGFLLVTRDLKQRKRPPELAAWKRHNLGVFTLAGKNRARCDIIRQVVRSWAQMKEYAAKTDRPFYFRVPASGGKIERLPL